MKQNYIEIKNDGLVFAFKELGESEEFRVTFQRTLRIPDDNKKYSLPPSLGNFPLAHVEDYASKVPESWGEHGGIFFPMYQAEAMWMNFSSASGRPYAIKIASGKVNAVSGETWSNELHGKKKEDRLPIQPYQSGAKREVDEKPDYMVAPDQPWLDGFNVGKGVIRQFVAVPLDSGYTVEEQVTGKAEHGGIQIMVYPMKDEVWNKIKAEQEQRRRTSYGTLESMSFGSSGGMMKKSATRGILRASSAKPDMGMGAGGMMEQKIYEDKYGLDAWDTEKGLRLFVHLANSEQYREITGKNPPTQPFTSRDYQTHNYPWFEYYSDAKAIEGSDILSKVDSIGSMQTKKDEQILPDNGVGPNPHQKPHVLGKKTVNPGKW